MLSTVVRSMLPTEVRGMLTTVVRSILPTVVRSMLSRSRAMATMISTSFRDSLKLHGVP